MSVNSLNTTQTATVYTTASKKSDKETKSENKTSSTTTTANAANEAAVYEKSSQSNKSETYKPDQQKIDAMIRESDAKVDAFRKMMDKVFDKQGMTFNESITALKSILNPDGTSVNIELDEETRQKLQEEIGEDGYWGVEQTATRIMDFAKALSGGDPSKIELLREAVQGAFDKAEKQWGEKLPEVSQKTYDEVMKRFDEWAEESKNPTESSTLDPQVS